MAGRMLGMTRFLLSKQSTGLVGVSVNPAARSDLIGLYQQTLAAAAALPDVPYRSGVEATAKEGLSVLESDVSNEAAELAINRGQLEELVLQAEAELGLMAKMAEWKPWDGENVPEVLVETVLRAEAARVFPSTMFSENLGAESQSGAEPAPGTTRNLNLEGAGKTGATNWMDEAPAPPA